MSAQCSHLCAMLTAGLSQQHNIEPQCSSPKGTTSEQDEHARRAAEKEQARRAAEEERAKRAAKEERAKVAIKCGSCYGAEEHSPLRNKCCESCQDVKIAYQVGRVSIASTILTLAGERPLLA